MSEYVDLPAVEDDGTPNGNTARIFEEDIELAESMGNALMRSGEYENAVQAYALALRWRVALTSKDKRENIPGKTKRGAWAESVAATFLLEQGFEVFRNIAPCGPIDLVAVTTGGETIFIDVKTTIPDRAGKRRYSIKNAPQEQVALGVEYIYVNPNGSCEWERLRSETGFHPLRRADDEPST